MFSIGAFIFHARTNPFAFWFIIFLAFSGTLTLRFGEEGLEVCLGVVVGGTGGEGSDGNQVHWEGKW